MDSRIAESPFLCYNNFRWTVFREETVLIFFESESASSK